MDCHFTVCLGKSVQTHENHCTVLKRQSSKVWATEKVFFSGSWIKVGLKEQKRGPCYAFVFPQGSNRKLFQWLGWGHVCIRDGKLPKRVVSANSLKMRILRCSCIGVWTSALDTVSVYIYMILTHIHIILQFRTIYLYIIIRIYVCSIPFVYRGFTHFDPASWSRKKKTKKTSHFTPRIITPSAVEDTPALHKKWPTEWAKIQKGPTKWKDMYGNRHNYRKKISLQHARVPTAAGVSIISYPCKKTGKNSKRNLQLTHWIL